MSVGKFVDMMLRYPEDALDSNYKGWLTLGKHKSLGVDGSLILQRRRECDSSSAPSGTSPVHALERPLIEYKLDYFYTIITHAGQRFSSDESSILASMFATCVYASIRSCRNYMLEDVTDIFRNFIRYVGMTEPGMLIWRTAADCKILEREYQTYMKSARSSMSVRMDNYMRRQSHLLFMLLASATTNTMPLDLREFSGISNDTINICGKLFARHLNFQYDSLGHVITEINTRINDGINISAVDLGFENESSSPASPASPIKSKTSSPTGSDRLRAALGGIDAEPLDISENKYLTGARLELDACNQLFRDTLFQVSKIPVMGSMSAAKYDEPGMYLTVAYKRILDVPMLQMLQLVDINTMAIGMFLLRQSRAYFTKFLDFFHALGKVAEKHVAGLCDSIQKILDLLVNLLPGKKYFKLVKAVIDHDVIVKTEILPIIEKIYTEIVYNPNCDDKYMAPLDAMILSFNSLVCKRDCLDIQFILQSPPIHVDDMPANDVCRTTAPKNAQRILGDLPWCMLMLRTCMYDEITTDSVSVNSESVARRTTPIFITQRGQPYALIDYLCAVFDHGSNSPQKTAIIKTIMKTIYTPGEMPWTPLLIQVNTISVLASLYMHMVSVNGNNPNASIYYTSSSAAICRESSCGYPVFNSIMDMSAAKRMRDTRGMITPMDGFLRDLDSWPSQKYKDISPAGIIHYKDVRLEIVYAMLVFSLSSRAAVGNFKEIVTNMITHMTELKENIHASSKICIRNKDLLERLISYDISMLPVVNAVKKDQVAYAAEDILFIKQLYYTMHIMSFIHQSENILGALVVIAYITEYIKAQFSPKYPELAGTLLLIIETSQKTYKSVSLSFSFEVILHTLHMFSLFAPRISGEWYRSYCKFIDAILHKFSITPPNSLL